MKGIFFVNIYLIWLDKIIIQSIYFVNTELHFLFLFRIFDSYWPPWQLKPLLQTSAVAKLLFFVLVNLGI